MFCFKNRTTINLGELLNISIEASAIAGSVIRDVFNSGELQVKSKGIDDPMTIADLQAQKIIFKAIKTRWPGLRIIGEEESKLTDRINVDKKVKDIKKKLDKSQIPQVDVKAISPKWNAVESDRLLLFVDPLDATLEYTRGNVKNVMTLIGMAVDGVAVAGVISQPFVDNGHIMWALEGSSVQLDRDIGDLECVQDGQIVLIRTSKDDEIVNGVQKKIKPTRTLTAGGCGYKIYLLCQNLSNVFVHTKSKKWDTCAPEALLRCCGGTLTDLQGNPLEYSLRAPLDNGPIIATCNMNTEKHNELIQMINT